MSVESRTKSVFYWKVITNSITTSRLIVSIYVFWLMPPLNEFLFWFLLIIIGGGITDFFDGTAASFGGRTRGGALYDKGVDKCFCAAILYRLAYFMREYYFKFGLALIVFKLVWAIIGMEVLISIVGMIFAWIFKTRFEANIWGKSKMWAEVIAAGVCTLLLYSDVSNEYFALVIFCQLTALALGCMSFYYYLKDFIVKVKPQSNIQKVFVN